MPTIKLNLGCGPKLLPGFINVDLANNWSGVQPDVVSDLHKIPFPDEHADEIHAYHVLEHFYRYEVDAILDEWLRVLKVGGKLVLELPCLDKILGIFDHCHDNNMPIPMRLTLWGLYGDPKYANPEMMHRWCYSVSELTQMLERRGMTVRECDPKTHQIVRDMRIEAIK